MNALIAAQYEAPEVADEPVDAWSLDELDRDADLESLQWALSRSDGSGY